jgi:hypothetical protein
MLRKYEIAEFYLCESFDDTQGNQMSAYFLNATFDLQAKKQETILAMKI